MCGFADWRGLLVDDEVIDDNGGGSGDWITCIVWSG